MELIAWNRRLPSTKEYINLKHFYANTQFSSRSSCLVCSLPPVAQPHRLLQPIQSLLRQFTCKRRAVLHHLHFRPSCGAWATNTSPMYSNQPIAIYAKYTQNVDGNPQGIGGATATATLYWGDGAVDTLTETTTGDGLAVFTFNDTGRIGAINKTSLATVNFVKAGTPGCVVDRDRAAFFTLTPPNGNPFPGGGKRP